MTDLLPSTARRALGVLAGAQAGGRLPSVVGGVVRDGEVVWSAVRGHAARPGDLAAGDLGPAPDVATQYKIGSVTKTMTAALVMLARERGEVSLDDPLGRFLPDAPFPDATLRALLCHSAGITAEPRGSWWERSPGVDRTALLAAHQDAERVLESGSQHHYSNLGYGLLGEVVAEVTGSTWSEALHEQVLVPLGMSRTTYAAQEPAAAGLSVDALTGELVGEPHPDTGAMAAAGQLWSTVEDLATWLGALVDPDRSVLNEESLVAMRTPQASSPHDRAGSSYGLGLSISVGGGRMLVGHGGSMPGFTCGALVDVDSRTGAVVLSNAGYGLGPAVAELLEAVLDAEPPLPAVWRPTTTPVPPVVREVVGTWHWGHAPCVLRWDGRLLHVAPASGPGRVMTFAATEDPERFVGVRGYLTGETLLVRRHADGALSHLEVATFVWTRVPYDPQVPIPGGAGTVLRQAPAPRSPPTPR